jgi:cytochrome c-type biogenesis protein CcmH
MATDLLAAGSPIRRWAPWLAVLVVSVAVLSIAAFGSRSAPTAQDRVTTISKSLKCPVCSGESVAESNAPAAQEIRRNIAEQVQQGQTDDEIRRYYAAKYGEETLLTPSSSGVNALVWLLPVVALAVAIAVLVIVFRRWNQEPAEHATEADRALVDAALHANGSDGSADDEHGEGSSR